MQHLYIGGKDQIVEKEAGNGYLLDNIAGLTFALSLKVLQHPVYVLSISSCCHTHLVHLRIRIHSGVMTSRSLICTRAASSRCMPLMWRSFFKNRCNPCMNVCHLLYDCEILVPSVSLHAAQGLLSLFGSLVCALSSTVACSQLEANQALQK